MAKFGKQSRANLETCDRRIQFIFDEVIKHIDCSILEGYRDEETQNAYFNEGRSQLRFPSSRHNKSPALAVDAVPYPVDWDDREGFLRFAAFVLGVAAGLGIKMRWGGDWDRDWDLMDNRFNDFPHFELMED